MRSYGQFCGLAKSLDVIGDRWTLLIVRELLIRGPSRYTDLRIGMSPAPAAAAGYALTPRGEALETVIAALGRWAAPLLEAPAKDDVFLPHWLVLPARLYLTDRAPRKPPVRIEVRDRDERVTLEAANGRVTARVGPADQPDAVIIGPTPLAWQLLLAKIDLAHARKAGLAIEGKSAALKRFGPLPRQ